MRSFAAAKLQIHLQTFFGFNHRGISIQIYVLIFDGSPEPFDKNVIAPAALAIHADLNSISLEKACKFGAGELAALVRVEDIRAATKRYSFLQCFYTEVRCQRVRKPPGKNSAGIPVLNDKQISKASTHRDIRDVCRPYLIGANNR